MNYHSSLQRSQQESFLVQDAMAFIVMFVTQQFLQDFGLRSRVNKHRSITRSYVIIANDLINIYIQQ